MSSAIDTQILGFESQWEPEGPFDLVVLYEDTTTRNRALTLYDRLAQRLLDECDFRSSWWQLGQLSNPAFRDQASDAAALANMIILCFRAGSRLPDAVRSWLDGWLPRKSAAHRSALVTLIAGAPPYTQQICPVQIFLEKLARAANMDFFAHRFDDPEPTPASRSAITLLRIAVARSFCGGRLSGSASTALLPASAEVSPGAAAAH